MGMFENAKWIWLAEGECADQYAEFVDVLSYGGTDAILRISVDSDYAVFLNGKYVASGQYGDFEHYKIYDEIDLSPWLESGKNELKILAYHCGTSTARYRPAAAGLIYEVIVGGEAVLYSRKGVPSRRSPNYRSGLCRVLSVQLGFTFEYDAAAAGETEFSSSGLVKKECEMFLRPIKRHKLLPKREMVSIKKIGDTHYLVDLGGECVGLPTLELYSETEQTVTVAFGEHIKDGCVRKTIGARNLYYTYKTKRGENVFNEYMLRLGCRYFEVTSEKPIDLRYVGLIPQVYEVVEKAERPESELDKRIYDVCLNTLRLCMMEHYVDCPWREQALYAFDSRNQMLTGYFAFEGGNRDYARANLKLIGEDRRSDGLLSITYPNGGEHAIPSFSLHYIIAMWEYLLYTDDASLACEMMPNMKGILDEFLKGRREGLLCGCAGEKMWNFYDWSDGANFGWNSGSSPDVYVNCLFLMALFAYEKMCGMTGLDFSYTGLKEELTANVRSAFLSNKKLFGTKNRKDNFTTLGNSLAILSGVATFDEAKEICECIARGELEDCSLSAKVLEYEAILMTDEARWRDFILDEIRRSYSVMLDAGSDTVWETLGGCDDFSGAGSLCHGWSAVPIYFYHRLGMVK